MYGVALKVGIGLRVEGLGVRALSLGFRYLFEHSNECCVLLPMHLVRYS